MEKGGGERNKDTKQGDGAGGKCINGRKRRKKTTGVQLHHGISGERESDSRRLRRCSAVAGVQRCCRGPALHSRVCGGQCCDTGEERPCIF